MNGRQRWQYFLDYYLLYTIIAAGIAAVFIFGVWHFMKPESKNLLYVAVVDESLDQTELAKFKGRLEEKLGADGKGKKVLIDDSFYSREDGIHKLEVYVRNSQVDIVIAPSGIFDILAGFGFMQDAKEVLGETAAQYEQRFYRAAGYRDTEEISFDDHETGQGGRKNYGIDISDSSVYERLQPLTEEPVMGFIVDMPNQANAVSFLEMLEE